MADFVKIKDILDEVGIKTALEMIRILQSNDKIATGKLIKSIDYKVIEAIDGLKLIFEQEDYGEFVNSGRKPGSYPPISKIKQWTKTKGLPEKAAFPIANKIFKFGIKPVPFMEPLRTIDEMFIKELEKDLPKKIELYLDEKLKNIK